MANTHRERPDELNDEPPPSGVPRPHRLGASKNEAVLLGLALFAVALIVVGFWYEASH